MAAGREPKAGSGIRWCEPGPVRVSSRGFCNTMDNLSGYAHRPFAFVLRYLRRRLSSHIVILLSVVAAVACSVGTQYGVKALGRRIVGGNFPRRQRMAGIHFPHVADRGG